MLAATALICGCSSGEHFELKADLNAVERACFHIFTSSIRHTLISKHGLLMPAEIYSWG